MKSFLSPGEDLALRISLVLDRHLSHTRAGSEVCSPQLLLASFVHLGHLIRQKWVISGMLREGEDDRFEVRIHGLDRL